MKTSNGGRSVLYGLMVMLLPCSVMAQEREEDPPAAVDPALEAMRQKWRLWERLDVSDGRKVTKARLVMQNYIFSEPQKPTLDTTVSDGEVLKFLERGFSDVQIRAPRKLDGIAGVLPIGYLICTMSDGDVKVFIYPHCFALTDIPEELRDHGPFSFHSPELAYVLDAILKAKGHPQLKAEQLEGLTGERQIKATIKYVKKLIAESKALGDNRE